MLWRRPKRTWDQKKADFESVIRRVYTYERIRLALARMKYFVGYNVQVRSDAAGSDIVLESPSDFQLSGVLHEIGPGGQPHVHCDLEFVDAEANDGIIGWCVLTAYGTPKNGERIEERPMMLDVKIYDPEKKYRYILYDAMRDAALSGNRFFHVEVKTDCVDETEAIRSMSEKGYGPQLRIRHLRMFPEIILPNAPIWGWKRS
jgi:hypothetical protein